MAKNKSKDTQNMKLKSYKEVEAHKDFFLHSLIEAVESSEEIYSCDAHKVVVIGTLKMLFFKFQLTEYMSKIEITEADYSRWFEKLAIENNVDNFLFYKMFGDEDEK